MMEERYPQAVQAARRFFERLYGARLAESEDDERDALVFEVGSTRSVAIDADFLAAYDEDTVFEKLTGWNVAHLSRTLGTGARLYVNAEGPEFDDQSGP